MAKKKYYAVKVGRNKGVYDTWDKCKREIDGYSGAIYKSFYSYDDAISFLEDFKTKDEKQDVSKKIAKAYVDGSYSESEEKYSYGCVILIDDNILKFGGVDNNIDYIGMKNVAGELLGSMEAIKWAKDNNYDSVIIYHDYEGIERWANNNWKANKKGTKEYVRFINDYRKYINISFVKVQAHSGDTFNEEADRLAKEFLLAEVKHKIYKENDSIENEDLIMFNRIMSKKDSTKNTITFKYNEFDISESKLKKYAKELWVSRGNDKGLIDSINLKFNIEESIIFLQIKDNEGKLHDFNIKL